MSLLLTFGLANAVCAALLALAALLVGRFCRRPAVLHSLWLLVLLKLVTPPFWPITVANLPEEPAAPVETTVAQPTRLAAYRMLAPPSGVRLELVNEPNAEPMRKAVGKKTVRARLHNASTNRDGEQVTPALKLELVVPPAEPAHSAPSAVASQGSENWQRLANCVPLLVLAWLAGVAVWLAWAGRHIVRFHHLLRHARRAGPEVQQQSDALAAGMGLSRPPEIWLLPGSLSPLVWGAIGRVRIFFPAKLLARLDDTERASLLAHELAHVRRRDHWVRWLELMASALYWWYPLVWLARRRLHIHEEECCDAWVIGEVPARVYAGAILNTLDFLAEDRAPLPVMASGLAGVELLKRRLCLIMTGGAPKRLSRSGKSVLFIAGLLLLSLRPNLARTQTKPPEIQETKEKPAAKVESASPAEEPKDFNPQPRDLHNQKLESAALASACSPDGKTLALALEDGAVQLRDAGSGELQLTLKGHDDAVTCVAFTPDGKSLASGSPDNTVRLWDSATGKLLRVLRGHANWIYAVAFSPDGKTLASGSYDKTIRLWDAATGQTRRILKGHKASIRALAFSPDGETLASAGSDRSIRLWPMNGKEEAVVLKGHEDTIRALVFSPDGKTLASGSDDQTIKLWDVAKQSERAALKGHTAEVTTLTFSPRGKTLVSGGADHLLILWDPAAGRPRGQFRGHGDALTSVLFAPDGRRILSAGLDRMVKVWSAQSSPLRLLRGHTGPVVSLVISGDGRRLLTGSGWPQGDKTARLWDIPSGKQLRVFRAETPPVDKGPREEPNQIGAVALSPDGKQAVAAGVGGVVFLWDVETGKELRRFQGHVGAINALDFSPDGQQVLSGGRDKTIRLWEVKSGRQLHQFEGSTEWVRSVRFDRDGRRFLSGGRDGVLRLWDVDSGKPLRQFQETKGWIQSLAWMPDNRQAVCAAGGSVIQLWNVENGKLVRTFQGHAGGVTGVDVSPDGRGILSCGYDGTVRYWDTATGRQRKLFRPREGFVWVVKFSRDGRLAITGGGGRSEGGGKYVSGGNDFPIRVWPLGNAPTSPSRARGAAE